MPEQTARVRDGVSGAGGAAWLFGTVGFTVAQLLAAAAWPVPYRLSHDVISDLGNTACGLFGVPGQVPYPVCSPWHALMNASFVAAGVLTIVGTVCLATWWPAGRAAGVSWYLWLATGLGKIVVGLAPENTDLGLHLLGALNIPLGILAVLTFSAAVRRAAPRLAATGAVLGVVGIVGLVLFSAGDATWFGPGGGERVAACPDDLWLVIVAVVVLRGARPWPAGRRLIPASMR